LDFRITYTTDFDGSSVVITGVLSSPYTAIDLFTGSTYSFTIESRNVFGYSDPSSELQIYSGFVPDAPNNLQTAVSGAIILITWDESVNNGAVLTAYTI
jgi:hypothetical protein